MIRHQDHYLEFLKRRGLDRRTRQDYISRLRRVHRLLDLRISPQEISSTRAVKRTARRLKSQGVLDRSAVDCAVALQRYYECFHAAKTDRNHWVEVYWPREPGAKRGEDGMLYLYFHRQKRSANEKIKKGDLVLFYETKQHPDEEWLGAQTIFALGTVADDQGEPITPHGRSGGRTWIWKRAVKPSKIVAAQKGIPFDTFRRLMRWKSSAKLRRGPMLIEPDQFSALARLLQRDGGRERAQAGHGGGRAPRQPDVFKRLKLERAAIVRATRWYEDQGYIVTSVERDRAGWDLEAVSDSHRLLVEVKGLSGRDICVGLTPNEYKMMRSKSHRKAYRLFVVTSALSPSSRQHEFFYSNDPPRWEAIDGRTLRIREVVGAVASYG